MFAAHPRISLEERWDGYRRMFEGVTLKPIPFCRSGNYMAGNDGIVYSRRYNRPKVWYALKSCVRPDGYLCVGLQCGPSNKMTVRLVHRIICSAFHGEPPGKSSEVRHLDGTRTNNNPKNLCWGSSGENHADMKSHGRTTAGESHPGVKLNNEIIKRIRQSYVPWKMTCQKLADCYGVSFQLVHQIVKRKIWNHI